VAAEAATAEVEAEVTAEVEAAATAEVEAAATEGVEEAVTMAVAATEAEAVVTDHYLEKSPMRQGIFAQSWLPQGMGAVPEATTVRQVTVPFAGASPASRNPVATAIERIASAMAPCPAAPPDMNAIRDSLRSCDARWSPVALQAFGQLFLSLHGEMVPKAMLPFPGATMTALAAVSRGLSIRAYGLNEPLFSLALRPVYDRAKKLVHVLPGR
jgi:hypothetical protein